jgi:hypothetical protein
MLGFAHPTASKSAARQGRYGNGVLRKVHSLMRFR